MSEEVKLQTSDIGEANNPIKNRPMPISSSVLERPVNIAETPNPIKNMAIIPDLLHRSPNHPAGMVPTAKARNPGTESESKSPYDCENSVSSVSTTVGYRSINR